MAVGEIECGTPYVGFKKADVEKGCKEWESGRPHVPKVIWGNIPKKGAMNLSEIYQALLDGKKLCCPNNCYRYVHLKDGELKHDDGSLACISFTMGEWSIYEEPEDLDQKIQAMMLVAQLNLKLGDWIQGTYNLGRLIDLKIKKAKLG